MASKLVELRRKTDRELLAVAKPELRRARILANVAATRESPFYEQARKIVDGVAGLMPTISGVDRREREAIASIIKDVQLALASIPAQPAKRLALCS